MARDIPRNPDQATQIQSFGRTPQELRDAALKMASLDVLDTLDEYEVEEQLAIVLAALGLRVKDYLEPGYDVVAKRRRGGIKRYDIEETPVSSTPMKRDTENNTCGRHRGTIQGYNRHISAYNTPCPPCSTARTRQLDEQWERLGIPSYAREGVKRW